MMKRLVITGMGAVTPVGIGVTAYWEGIVSGKCGIGPVERIDVSQLPVKQAAEVRDFQPADYLPARLVSDLDVFMQYAFVAAEEAIRQSGLPTESPRVGVVMGTALGGLGLIGETQEKLAVSQTPVGPRFLPKVLGNIAAAQLAIRHGIRGPSMTISTACSSGGDAVTLAALLLQAGSADAIVVMAGEAGLSPLTVHTLYKVGALSKTASSRPFDANRDGFVIGEGGGALVLETEEHARARGAVIYGELLGCANNTDAYNPVSPRPEGDGAAACMRLALAQAGLTPADIGYVNAHGTATIAGDAAESKAIRQVFGDYDVPVSSTKGATGHMMGAGGVTEVIACLKAMETGLLPPSIHCETQDEACRVNLITRPDGHKPVRIAMSNALGFGGQNSSVIVGKYSG